MYEENYETILMSNVQLFAFCWRCKDSANRMQRVRSMLRFSLSSRFSIAKLRREFEGNKKTAEIFLMLLRQSPDFATKRENCAQSCPKDPPYISHLSSSIFRLTSSAVFPLSRFVMWLWMDGKISESGMMSTVSGRLSTTSGKDTATQWHSYTAS